MTSRTSQTILVIDSLGLLSLNLEGFAKSGKADKYVFDKAFEDIKTSTKDAGTWTTTLSSQIKASALCGA